MKMGAEDRKKRMIAGIAGGCALLALYPLYQELFGGPSTPPPAPPVVVTTSSVKSVGPSRTVAAPPGFAVGQGAQKVGTTGAQLDPTLHMEAMRVTESLVYSGSGRNIFSGGMSEAEALPKAIATARPAVLPQPIQSARIVDPGPPPPPPINLKFFGTATSANGTRRAFLLNGDDVFLASAGDVVQRRYKVVTISANSILVEDMPNNNRQSLPLVGN